ncbi:MAG: hypothetical protein K5945_07880 [Bacteroidaceae bacterium]|nr:hypothetical protein [Bacteroidaceae bacterium]
MKRFIACLCLIVLIPAFLSAQELEAREGGHEDAPADTLFSVPDGVTLHAAPSPFRYWLGGPMSGPLGMYPMGDWPLHEGLNAQVGAGVRVGWGKHSPWRGASFFSDASLLYATPLSDDGRWTGAIGGYHSNYRLWGHQVNTLGVMGLVDYRINDHLNVGGFLVHDFGIVGGQRGLHGPMLPFESPSTTLGADLGVRLSPSAILNIGVSFTRYENPLLPPPPPLIRER